MGTGFPIISHAESGAGLNLSALFAISKDSPLYIGAEFGYLRHSKTFSRNNEVHLDTFHLAPTAIYRLSVSQKIHLYGGMLLFPSLATAHSPIFNSKTAVKVAFAMRPGVEYELNPFFSFAGELRMGATADLILTNETMVPNVDAQDVIGTGFLFFPMVWAVLKF